MAPKPSPRPKLSMKLSDENADFWRVKLAWLLRTAVAERPSAKTVDGLETEVFRHQGKIA